MQVSIIIPVYNAEFFVDRALTNALAAGAQVPGKFEIVAVDNGSTDSSIVRLKSASARYPKIIRVVSCACRGAAAARNYGVAHSSGEWLQFLDVDDTIGPDKIARQLAVGERADWVVGAYRNIYPNGSTEDILPHPDLWRGLVYGYRTGNTNANLIRRSALTNAGGWDEKQPTNEDLHLWFMLLRMGARAVVDPVVDSVYHHHTVAPRLSRSDFGGTLRRRIQLLAEANAWLIGYRPEYWHQHAPFFLGALLRSVRMLATFDLDSAASAYAAYFGQPNEWAIDRPYELVPRYTRLYPYLGFRAIEQMRLVLAGVVPSPIKQWLKR